MGKNAQRRRAAKVHRQPLPPIVESGSYWCNACGVSVPAVERYGHLQTVQHQSRLNDFAIRKAIFDAGFTSPCDPMR